MEGNMSELPLQQLDYQKETDFQFTWRELFVYFGPGLLVSIAYLDPGNLSADIDSGTSGKYHLLWVLFLSTFLGYFFQNRAMMLGLVTGKDMAKLCRLYYPRKSSLLLWCMTEIAIMGSDIQEVLGSAYALNVLFGLKIWIGVLCTIASTMFILLIKQIGQRKLELLFALLIGIMAVSFFIELGLIKPDFGELCKGIFVPYVPSSALSQMVGLIGSVLMPHNLYLHSSLVQEKKIRKQDIGLLKKSIFYFKIETGISLLISFFISLAVIGTFAFWYVPGGGPEIDLVHAGDYLQTKFGSYAKYIWGVGLLAAGQSSTITGTLAGQFVMQGFIKISVSKFKRAFITRTIAIIPSILIAFLGDSSEDFNNYLNILQAIQLPFAIIPLLKLSLNKKLMGEFVISKIEVILLSVFSTAIVGVNYYNSIPTDINWKQAWVYIAIVIMVIYFIFMAIVLFTKLQYQQQIESSYTSGSKINNEQIDVSLKQNEHLD